MGLPVRTKLAVLAAGAAILVSAGVLAQGGAKPEAGEKRPAGAEAPAGSAAPAPRPPSAGYSWHDKPRKRTWRRRKIDPNKPLATYPGFRMMPDGTSMIWLQISKKVNVTVRQAQGRVSYLLPDVQVGVHNNTNPLVTTHFDTPVSRAHLARTKQGAVLVVQLREPVSPTYQVSEGPRGTMLLKVLLPKAQRHYSQTPVPSPTRPRAGTSKSRTSPGSRGTGPRL